MIGTIVVGLLARSPITLKGMGGEALHGFFFNNLLRRNSPELATKLHRQEEQRPFSISPLLQGYELNNGRSIIPNGGGIAFRLGLLTEKLLTASISTLFTAMAEGRILYLSGKPVAIENIDMSEGKFTSFSELLEQARSENIITLEFITPTSFKGGGIQILFPEPKLVFSSLLKRWNALSEAKLPEESIESFAQIKVSNYNLRTELVHFSRYKIIGFKGKVEYRLPQESSESFQQVVNALADFAFYAGVGAKTAMGMGQTRRID